MKEETTIELLKLATQLACATIGQNVKVTATRSIAEGDGAVETILKDCVKAVQARYHDLNRAE